MKVIIATYGQTLMDIALQEYGCIEGLFEIIKLNTAMHLSYELTAAEAVIIDDVIPKLTTTNLQILKQLQTQKALGIGINSTYHIEPVLGQFLPQDFNNEFINN